MKIWDPKNTGARLKVFLLWGVLLFVFNYISINFFSPSMGVGVAAILSLLFAGFAGYMAAGALKNKTGDKWSSAGYGAVVPIFATLIGWIVALITSLPLDIQLPLLPMLAGLVGGYISQRRF